MNENYTIPAFAEPITDLPDTPSLTAAELKRRFQAPADEVRLAHNALAECVEGITSATYPDTVTEDMLTDALADKINGKADETSVTARFSAETAARAALQTELEAQIAQKCEIYCGTFTTTEYTTTVEIGFRAAAILIFTYGHPDGITGVSEFGTLALDGVPSESLTITDTGFIAGENLCSNFDNTSPLRYIAFKTIE